MWKRKNNRKWKKWKWSGDKIAPHLSSLQSSVFKTRLCCDSLCYSSTRKLWALKRLKSILLYARTLSQCTVTAKRIWTNELSMYVCLYRYILQQSQRLTLQFISIKQNGREHLFRRWHRQPDISPVNLINFLTNPRTEKKCKTKPMEANEREALDFKIVRFA